eukprot:UN12959
MLHFVCTVSFQATPLFEKYMHFTLQTYSIVCLSFLVPKAIDD